MKDSSFSFKKGPVFSNIVLIDEINRAPAKTQAALFEVMEERKLVVAERKIVEDLRRKIEQNDEIISKKYREKDTDSKDFWMPILKQKSFRDFIETKYRVASGEIIKHEEEETEDETA